MAGFLCAVDGGTTRGYIYCMKTVAIQDVQSRFDELARDVERGEVVTVTRDGKPVLDIVAHKDEAAVATRKGSFDWEAGQAYLRDQRIAEAVPYIADDFDDPLPADFLLKPLP